MWFLIALIFLCNNTACNNQVPYTSQSGQDEFVDFIFQQKCEGTFVEVGALWGKVDSNTYFFEKARGWRGICIEPVLDFFNQLKEVRTCICVNCAIARCKGREKFIWFPETIPGFSGLERTYAEKSWKLITEILSPRYGADRVKHKIIEVDTIPLMDVLATYDLKDVDYLSIDTEGNELEIIESIDFTKVDIKVIGVENNYADENMRVIIKERGYTFVKRMGMDDFFIKNSCKDLIAKASENWEWTPPS